MANNNISSVTSQQQSLRIILGEQKQMSTLQEQLASGNKTGDLSELSTTESRRLLDLRTEESQRNAYLQTAATVEARLKTQDNALTSISDMTTKMLTYISGATNYDNANSQNISSLVSGYLQQIQGYLNQQVDGRYLYAGSRYNTQPVVDLKNLLATTNPPTEAYPFTPAVSPNLPTYDTEQIPAGTATDSKAYDINAATIDNNVQLNYGISSDNPAFQNLILGLRWAYAATTDQANYTANMTKARALLTSAQTGIYQLQAANAANISQLTTVTNDHNTLLSIIKTDEDGIMKADSNEVAAKITMLESQIQASYTVTGKIANLSLANYL